jgi:hypothetical protein
MLHLIAGLCLIWAVYNLTFLYELKQSLIIKMGGRIIYKTSFFIPMIYLIGYAIWVAQ